MTNVATVQALFDAFANRDTVAIRRLFDPQIESVQNDGFPNGGRHVGADTVLKDVFARFGTEWSAWRAVVTEWLDAGETVVALGEYCGTHQATGRSMTAAFAHVYDVRDGRITRFRQYTDTALVRDTMQRTL
jgi:uncharacterized protein